MKPYTTSTGTVAPFLLAKKSAQTPEGGFPYEFLDLCSRGMDRAFDIHKATLAAAVCWHSCAIDIYKNASCLTPHYGAFLDMSAKSFAICMELHSTWLSLLLPLSEAAGECIMQAEATAEELAYHMDIAIGERSSTPSSTAPGSTASHSGRQAKPAAKSPASSMDIAIGSQVA